MRLPSRIWLATAVISIAAGLGCAVTTSTGSARRKAPVSHFVEIRSYNLERGTRTEFHRLMSEITVPMLRRWNVDVVAFGPSPQDADSYYLIRSYLSLDDRQRSQDAFYGSAEWRQGPREATLELIESYSQAVLILDDRTLQGLRR